MLTGANKGRNVLKRTLCLRDESSALKILLILILPIIASYILHYVLDSCIN